MLGRNFVDELFSDNETRAQIREYAKKRGESEEDFLKTAAGLLVWYQQHREQGFEFMLKKGDTAAVIEITVDHPKPRTH